jgi:hypothetical protein
MSDFNYNDFGFTAVDSDDLLKIDEKVSKTAASSEENQELVDVLSAKVDKLDNFIRPLLENLAKDSDKDYIYWPNRIDIVRKQIDNLNSIIEG